MPSTSNVIVSINWSVSLSLLLLFIFFSSSILIHSYVKMNLVHSVQHSPISFVEISIVYDRTVNNVGWINTDRNRWLTINRPHDDNSPYLMCKMTQTTKLSSLSLFASPQLLLHVVLFEVFPIVFHQQREREKVCRFLFIYSRKYLFFSRLFVFICLKRIVKIRHCAFLTCDLFPLRWTVRRSTELHVRIMSIDVLSCF